MKRQEEDSHCEVCLHHFARYHREFYRLIGTPEEERRKRCRDCRACKVDDDSDFTSIVKGIKDHNRTAPEREPMPV